MLYRLKIFLVTLTLLKQTMGGFAQVLLPEAHFNRYTMLDGLPDNNITTLVKDNQGFLWVGTEAGLGCFDGVHFTNYFKGDDPKNSLPSDYIVKMVKLPNGKIAIATKLGLSLLDPVARSFKSKLAPCEPEMMFAQNAIGPLVLTSKGNIVTGSNAGICVFDTALNVVFQYSNFKKEDLDTKRMGFGQVLLPLTNGDVLISGWNGFWRYSAKTNRVEKQDAKDFGEPIWERINAAGKDDMSIWRDEFPDTITLRNLQFGQAGTTRLSKEIKYELHWRASLNFVNDTLMGFAGCNNGFRTAICDPATLQIRFSARQIFATQHFNAFLYDDEGRWWLASENGLFGQSFSKGLFRFVPIHAGAGPDGIPYTINGITKADGHFYLGMATKILVFDDKFRYLKTIGFPQEFEHIWGLTQWQSGTLEIFSTTGWKRLRLQQDGHAPPEWQSLGPSLASRSQLMDSRGDIWTGTETGVLRYNIYNGQQTHFDGRDKGSKFPYQGALKIIETDSGYLWMCGITGFTRWNPFKQTFDRQFKKAPGTEKQEGYPNAMARNGGEEILFALENNGLWCWQGDQRPAQRVQTGNHAFEFILDIFPDPRPHHFWLLLKSGIALLDVSSGKYRYITNSDGLPDESVKEDFYFDPKTDSIYTCYQNGIVVSTQSKLGFSDKQVSIFITGVKQLSTGQLLNVPTNINLEYPNQDLAIMFSSPDFERGRLLTYAYRLNKGNWQLLGSSKSIQLVNLSPGSYQFEVKSITSEGVSSEPANLMFCIIPRFYQTWWFLTLLVGGFGLAVFGYFRWRLSQLRKMEAMRQSIAADLHDEVGASLTSIQILAQLASHPDLERSAAALHKLPEQVRSTSASLREVVWNINPKGDALDLLIGELTRHAGEVFEKSDIEYTVQTDNFPKDVFLDSATRQHLVRIFKEILNNLTKHSHASRAAVYFKKQKNALTLVVRDNGQGFDPAVVHRGNGLANMQQRASAVAGQLVLRSSIDEGTEITLRMPLKRKRSWWRFF